MSTKPKPEKVQTDKEKVQAHLADAGEFARRRKPPKAKGILDQLGAEESLQEIQDNRVMPNDMVVFLGAMYPVVGVDLVKDTVKIRVGDDVRTLPRSAVSKARSCALPGRAPIRRRR